MVHDEINAIKQENKFWNPNNFLKFFKIAIQKQIFLLLFLAFYLFSKMFSVDLLFHKLFLLPCFFHYFAYRHISCVVLFTIIILFPFILIFEGISQLLSSLFFRFIFLSLRFRFFNLPDYIIQVITLCRTMYIG